MTAASIVAASPAAAQADPFRRCMAGLKPQAAAAGIPAASFDRLTANLTRDESVIEASQSQPEFKIPPWEYLAPLVDDERIADARQLLAKWSKVLDAAERRTGVDRYTIVAIWGVESDFGRAMGDRSLLRSLATLSCEGRRMAYFKGEFFRSMRIVVRGDIRAEKLTGSWAGAFGQTQFMPSNYFEDAIDLDGDGKVDLIDSVPDALGSAGNELRRSGWNGALRWGYEVKLPARFDARGAGRRNKKPYAQWAAMGVTRVDGQKLPADGTAGLMLPAGPKGPAFLVTRNFDAVYAYNASEVYGLAIVHLADRMRGGQPFVTPWPTEDRGLSRVERRELQTLLLARGYQIGKVDGLIGKATRDAIMAFQTSQRMEPLGRPTGQVLDALRRAR
jgi:lytic murein transglycosylase